jgi:hypothetical protein
MKGHMIRSIRCRFGRHDWGTITIDAVQCHCHEVVPCFACRVCERCGVIQNLAGVGQKLPSGEALFQGVVLNTYGGPGRTGVFQTED